MEHAVIVHLKLSDEGFATEKLDAIGELQREMTQAIENAYVGEFDGNEIGGGECVLYMYGVDADALFAVVKPLLKASPSAKGGFAIKRYGEASDPGAREVEVRW